MARGEIHVPLYVDFADDPKVRSLARYGKDARGARDLYVQMLCYCKRTLSDGYVPSEQIGLLVYPDAPKVGHKHASALVAVGLCLEADDGWCVSGYLKRNPSRQQVEEAAENKSRKAGEANHRRWHRSRVDPECEWCNVPTPSVDRSVDRSSIDNGGNPQSQSQSQSQSQKSSSKTRATKPPDNFEITDDLKAWAAEHAPSVKLVVQTARMLDWARSKGETRVDWKATWRNWMSRAEENTNTPKATAQTGYTDADRDRPAQTMTGNEWRQGA